MFHISIKFSKCVKPFQKILEYLNLFLIATKAQEMCKNAVDYYPHAFENVPDC